MKIKIGYGVGGPKAVLKFYRSVPRVKVKVKVKGRYR